MLRDKERQAGPGVGNTEKVISSPFGTVKLKLAGPDEPFFQDEGRLNYGSVIVLGQEGENGKPSTLTLRDAFERGYELVRMSLSDVSREKRFGGFTVHIRLGDGPSYSTPLFPAFGDDKQRFADESSWVSEDNTEERFRLLCGLAIPETELLENVNVWLVEQESKQPTLFFAVEDTPEN